MTNQTFTDIEIIVVNDGSTDDSMSIVKKYADRDARIRIIDKNNEGVAYARKSGVEIATGEYIHYLDGDDTMELDSYELLYEKACETGADMVVFEFRLFLDKPSGPIRNEDFKSNIDFMEISMRECRYLSLGLNIHRRDLYNNQILYAKGLTMGEDFYIVEQLAYHAKKISYLGKGLYNYILRPTSAVNSKITDKKAHDLLFHIKLIKDFLEDKPEYHLFDKYLCEIAVKNHANLYWQRYFKNTHYISKNSIRMIRKYPDIRHTADIAPLYKLIRLYSINGILGRIFAQYYILKNKI